ncbi:putative lipid-binding protein At4g00165 [Silene latifolia]|uniref:putative lipid-binding protein At4g00165 n=1 Tax=Silene latifolia TaxID=37657 RepID=UPI003D784CED
MKITAFSLYIYAQIAYYTHNTELIIRTSFIKKNMGSSKSVALIVIFNILCFTCVSSHYVPCSPPPYPSSPPSTHVTKCPKDTLKFGVCGSWLGLVTEVIGTKPSPECCNLVKGIADLEAAVCLCTALKANVLGLVKVKTSIALSLLLNGCGKKVPEGFKC